MKNFANEMIKRLSERFDGTIEIIEVPKVNMIMTGLKFEKPDKNVAPAIYLDYAFEIYKKEQLSLDEVAESLWEAYKKVEIDEYDVSNLSDWNWVKERIRTYCIDMDSNLDLLNTMVYTATGTDLAEVYEIVLNRHADGSEEVVKIIDKHLAVWGVSLDDLKKVAYENAVRDMQFMSMKEQMEELNPFLAEFMPDDCGMWVLTNKNYSRGNCFFVPDVLEKIEEKTGYDRFYILPSSIHEVIIITDTNGMDEIQMRDMVNEANMTSVSEDEMVNDSVYYYDGIQVMKVA